jgi:NADH-quinone oxidoreductase subunit M
MDGFPLLSAIVFTPAVGALLLLFVPATNYRAIRAIALIAALASFVFSLRLIGYDTGGAEFQFREDLPWIEAFGMRYTMGVDGLAVVLVLLTTLLSVVAIVYSFEPIKTRVKAYYITMLLLMVGMLGVFVSLDLFLFYVFWEISLFPMYFVIGIWGGPRRIYATVKFVVYTLVGSLLMLVAILAVVIAHGNETGTITFSYEALRSRPSPSSPSSWRSRSRCRCSRSIPGCRTRTSRPRRRARSSSPAFCSSWAASDSCAITCRCCRTHR